jgi:hypothetical protein
MTTIWEALLGASLVLSSAAPIKQRLTQAYLAHLAGVEPGELPRELREEFASITAALTTTAPMRGESAVAATVRKMSDRDASAVAARIVDVLAALVRSEIQTQPRLPLLRAVNGTDG